MKLFGILSLLVAVAIGGWFASDQFGLFDPPGVTNSGKEAIEQAKLTAPELAPAPTIALTQAVEVKANIVILDLGSKNLSGVLLPSLGELATLKELYLNNNQLTGLPSEIGKLTNLEVLDVSKNLTLSDLPPEIANLTSLRKLDIRGTNINKARRAELRTIIPEGAQLFD